MFQRASFPLLIVLISGGAAQAETVDLGARFQIAGGVADMAHSATQSGYTFRVDLKGLQYSGNVTRTLLERKESDKVTLWLALRDVRLTIARTDVVGQPGSAHCGRLDLVLGHRKDLWLAFDIVEDHEGSASGLLVRDVRFSLPPDNWSIGSPASVQVRGFGMTQERVVSGLRKGLADRRSHVEARLIDAAPEILAQVVRPAADAAGEESPIVAAIRSGLADESGGNAVGVSAADGTKTASLR